VRKSAAAKGFLLMITANPCPTATLNMDNHSWIKFKAKINTLRLIQALQGATLGGSFLTSAQ
jgi:hypothetical protein